MNDQHYDPVEVMAARIRAGYKTKQDAARHLNTTPRTVYRVENGICASYEILFKMAKAYNADVAQFLRK